MGDMTDFVLPIAIRRLHQTGDWRAYAAVGNIWQAAFKAIKIMELERSGIRDGDGV